MIEVKNLTKKYGNHVAVDHLNFHVEKGQIYGFLGPNGAGKYMISSSFRSGFNTTVDELVAVVEETETEEVETEVKTEAETE